MASGKFYRPIEDDLIREHYPLALKAEILRLMPDRTGSSIIQRACAIGVLRGAERKGRRKPFTGPALAHLTEAEKGYLAGIIDGEGTIMLCKRRNGREGRYVYAVQVSIANTSIALKVWLDARFPQRVYQTQFPSKLSKLKGYQWVLSGTEQCLRFLREIEPYLVIKRDQAKALMNGYVHLPEDERMALHQHIKDLKRAA